MKLQKPRLTCYQRWIISFYNKKGRLWKSCFQIRLWPNFLISYFFQGLKQSNNRRFSKTSEVCFSICQRVWSLVIPLSEFEVSSRKFKLTLVWSMWRLRTKVPNGTYHNKSNCSSSGVEWDYHLQPSAENWAAL